MTSPFCWIASDAERLSDQPCPIRPTVVSEEVYERVQVNGTPAAGTETSVSSSWKAPVSVFTGSSSIALPHFASLKLK